MKLIIQTASWISKGILLDIVEMPLYGLTCTFGW